MMFAKSMFQWNCIRLYIPNFLTISRLGLGLLFPFLSPQWWLAAVAWGILSEFLDGILARRMDTTSISGQILDPIADKIFFLSVMLSFMNAGLIEGGHVLLLSIRDILVVLGALFLLLRGQRVALRHMRPTYSGKLSTGCQLFIVLYIILFQRAPLGMIYLTGLISFLAALDYARRFFQGGNTVASGRARQQSS